jgi:hypothetical protein
MPYRKDRELAQDIQPNNHFQDGPAQMKHFRSLGLNIFRLPVSWQFLVNHRLGGKLEPRNFAFYDELVQACLKTGSHCIVDIHNYARWNRMIIGQGRLLPTEHLANLWGELAKKYAKEGRVIMGLMNEPHDSRHHERLRWIHEPALMRCSGYGRVGGYPSSRGEGDSPSWGYDSDDPIAG